MRFQIRALWSDDVKFECELDASFETKPYGLQLGAAFRIALDQKASLDGCNLDKINLSEQSFRDVRIYGSTFVGSRFAGSAFGGRRFVGSTFVGSRFDGSRFVGSTFVGSRFDGSRFVGSTFGGSTFDGSTFDGSTFDGSTFDGSTFDGSTFDGKNVWIFNGKKILLAGQRPFISYGPVGSRGTYVTAIGTADGIFVQTGCFTGMLARFKAQVAEKHGTNAHAREYQAFVTLA